MSKVFKMDALYSSIKEYYSHLKRSFFGRASYIALNLSKYFILARFYTFDTVITFLSTFYQDVTSSHVTKIVSYDTLKIKSKVLFRVNPLKIMYASFLKYVCKNFLAYHNSLNVDVLDVIKDHARPGCLFRIVYGSGESLLLPESGFNISVDRLDAIKDGENDFNCIREAPKPYIMINFGSIPLDTYIKRTQPFIRGTITARDLITMYCIDEANKYMNHSRVHQLLTLLLQNGVCLNYFDQDFSELEYKESDIVL